MKPVKFQENLLSQKFKIYLIFYSFISSKYNPEKKIFFAYIKKNIFFQKSFDNYDNTKLIFLNLKISVKNLCHKNSKFILNKKKIQNSLQLVIVIFNWENDEFFIILIYYKIIFTFDRKNIKYEWFNWYLIIMNLEELKNKLIIWNEKDNKTLNTRWLTKNEYIFLEYLKRKDLNIFLFDWEELNKFFENNKDFKKKSIITNLLKKKYLSNIWKWIYVVNWTWIDFDQLILLYLKKVSQKKKRN